MSNGTAGALLALVLALTACAEEEVLVSPPADSSLPGTHWVVAGLTVDGDVPALPTDSRPTLDFDEAGGVSGHAGCNSYFGTVAFTGGGVAVTDIGSTLMACEPEVMEREARFLAALSRVDTVSLDTGRLTLIGEGGAVRIDLDPFVPEPDRPLAGTVWHLTTLVDGEVASSIIAGTTPTLLVDDTAARISGSTGCNNYFGPASFAEEQVTVGALASTKMACAPEVMQQEAFVLAVLGGAATWEIEGSALRITAADGRALEFAAG
ncbi:MAG: META domain-containing protein [Acidimicrobiia bacterium]|nr:META domain-containing protein [Acidimicrobiia bacterium]